MTSRLFLQINYISLLTANRVLICYNFYTSTRVKQNRKTKPRWVNQYFFMFKKIKIKIKKFKPSLFSSPAVNLHINIVRIKLQILCKQCRNEVLNMYLFKWKKHIYILKLKFKLTLSFKTTLWAFICLIFKYEIKQKQENRVSLNSWQQ